MFGLRRERLLELSRVWRRLMVLCRGRCDGEVNEVCLPIRLLVVASVASMAGAIDCDIYLLRWVNCKKRRDDGSESSFENRARCEPLSRAYNVPLLGLNSIRSPLHARDPLVTCHLSQVPSGLLSNSINKYTTKQIPVQNSRCSPEYQVGLIPCFPNTDHTN